MADDNKPLVGIHENGDIDWPLIFPLRKTVKAMEEEYSALTINEPTANHVVKHGLLTRGLNDDNFAPLLKDLTDIPEASLLKMAAADFCKLSSILNRFFVQAGR